MRTIYLLLLSVLLGLFLLALFLLGPEKPDDDLPPLKISLGIALQPTDALPILASEKGFFKAEGLDVTLQAYPSGKRALKEGLLSGKVDIIGTTEIPAVMALLAGNDLQILASVGTADNVNRIIARSDRGIKTAADLKDKRIATQRASAVHYFLHLFQEKHNIAPLKHPITFMKAEELPGALVSGTIDAFSMREPYIGRAKELLGEKSIVFEMPGAYLQSELMLATTAFCNENPDVYPRLLRALLRAETYFKTDREEALRTVAARLGIPRDTFASLIREFDLRVRLDQTLLMLLENQARWAIESGVCTAKGQPNFLEHIRIETMRSVKPEAVTIIR